MNRFKVEQQQIICGACERELPDDSYSGEQRAAGKVPVRRCGDKSPSKCAALEHPSPVRKKTVGPLEDSGFGGGPPACARKKKW